MSAYARLLRRPHVAVLLGATLLGRLPVAINGLAVLLFVRDATGSFAVAGMTTGGLALGTAVGAPLVARLVDRRGVGVLLGLAIIHATSLLSIWGLGEAGAPDGFLVALAAVAGTAFPPTGSVLRSRWEELVGPGEMLRTAFAFDSVMIEVSFVSGPLITAVLVTVAGAEAAIALSAALVVIGTLVFLARLPPEPDPVPREAGARGVLGALGSPAIRLLALTTLPFGFCIGSIEVALPAFSDAENSQALAGVLLAVWSGASGIGGLVFGSRRFGSGPVASFVLIAALFPFACLPLLLASAPAAMVALAVLAGLPIAPLIASRNELAGELAAGGTRTEAFTWLLTALLSGAAAGTAVAGSLADAEGWRAVVVAGCAVAALGSVASLLGRGLLVRAAAVSGQA